MNKLRSAPYYIGRLHGFRNGFIVAAFIFSAAFFVTGQWVVYKYEHLGYLKKTNNFMMDFYESGYVNLHKKEQKQKEKRNASNKN